MMALCSRYWMNISARMADVGAPMANPSFCVYSSLLCCM
jgi:hypothetical protein